MRAYELGQYKRSMPNILSWGEELQLCRELGFDYLEMSVDESDERLARLQYTREERGAIMRAVEEIGVRIHSVRLSGHRKYPLGHPDEHIQKKALQIMEAAVQLVGDLGIHIIQLAGYDIYYEEGSEQAKQNFIHNLRHCVELAAKEGIPLGFETMETPFIDMVEKNVHYVQETTSPYLDVHPDTGNLKNTSLLYRKNVNENIRTGKGHIMATRLKETVPGHYRGIPFGNGHTEFVENVRELRQQDMRMFVREFWCMGNSDWQKVCTHTSTLLRDKLSQVFV